MKFVFLNGSLAGRKVDTDQSVVSIGSDKANLLVISEPGISSKHAYIEKLDGQWMIFDCKSTNGVFINDEKIDRKSEISDYDTVKLAEVEFVILISKEAKSPVNEKKISVSKKVNGEAAKGLEQRRIKRQKQKSIKRARNLVALAGLVLVGCIIGLQQYEKIDKKLSRKPVAKKDVIQLVETSEPLVEVNIQHVDTSESLAEDKKTEVVEPENTQGVVEQKIGLIEEIESEVVEIPEVKIEPEVREVAKLDRKSFSIHRFTEKYCFSCHNEKKQKGKYRLDNADFSFNTHASVYQWQDILDVLNTGEMPPEDEERPSDEELSTVIGEITTKLQSARNKLAATGGVITMRHLNRREYLGSIKDLFNAEVPVDTLPLDAPEGLDTDGSQQFFTSNHYKMYYNLGTKIAQSAIDGLSNKEKLNKVSRLEPEVQNNRMANQWVKKFGKGKLNIENYRGLSFDDLKKRLMKEYKGKIGRIILPRDVSYLLDSNHKHAATGRVLASFRVIPGYRYKLSVYSFGNTDQTVPLVYESATNNKYVADIKFSPDDERHKTEFIFQASLLKNKTGFRINTPRGSYIDYIVFEPLETEKSPFELAFGDILNKKPSDMVLKKALTQFALRAFRTAPPSSDYIDALASIYKDEIKKGKSPGQALVTPIATLLTSPAFLYIKEYNGGKRQIMKDSEFAHRLSYFLLGAPADDQLLATANSGKLRKYNGLKSQVTRILHSERSEFAINDFFAQWMELSRFEQVTIPGHIKGQLNESIQEEPLKFFNFLVKNNLPVQNLIDSDFAVIDPSLAKYYGISQDFEGFQAIKLPKDSNRGGLLTQAAFLMMGSAGPRTSPTIRGTVIRSKFLNDPPPPPPPNVPQLETKENGTQTVKELVNLHKEVAQCRSCHEKIDPIGYGLENFDHLGVFRTKEGIKFKKHRNALKATDKVPVDPQGYINKSNSFNNLKGFKAALMQEKDKLARSIFESLLSYGIGRKIEFIDEAEINECLERLKKKNYPMTDMIVEVVNSKIFRTK